MPWTKKDADKYRKGLTDKQKTKWAKIANNVLSQCLKKGGTDQVCAPKAIKIANAKIQESMDDIVVTLQNLREAGKVLSTANKTKIENAIKALQDILSKVSANESVSYGEQREAIDEARLLTEAESYKDLRNILRQSLKDAYNDKYGPFLEDFSDSWVVFERDHEVVDTAVAGKLFRADYTIEGNKATFSNIREVVRKIVYEEVNMQTESTKLEERSLVEKPVKLVEKIAKDGTLPIKVIGPGWGSSGYYPAEVLKEAAPVYKSGTKMYLDHPTKTEEKERPERSVKDLAAVLISDGEYKENGHAGPGVYALAKVFSDKQDFINEKGPWIGLSHRAAGKAYMGEAEGKKGPIISKISEARSVDFVTIAGAQGQIVEMFESYKSGTMEQTGDVSLEEVKKERDNLNQENKKLKERLLMREAKDFVASKLQDSKLPQITADRIVESLSTQYPVTDKGELDQDKFKTKIEEAIKEEKEYISKLTGSGSVKDLGESGSVESSQEESEKEMLESWKQLGYSEEEAKIAMQGRK